MNKNQKVKKRNI